MIIRVKKICQIGGFREFKTGASVPFSDNKKVTLVHGMNTLGKTTFAQILKSLGNDEPVIIQKRHSIPPIPSVAQEVEMSYKNLAGKEETVKYKNGAWTPSELKGRILVFDQEFINSHVMTGDTITRDNKETFTDFILGTEGVALTQKIEKDRKTYRTDKARLSDFRPEYVKGAVRESDVQRFIDLVVKEDTPILEAERESHEKTLRRLEKIDDFKTLNEPLISNTSAEKVFNELQEEHVLILDENYKNVSDEASQILQSQISENCDGDHAVSWLKTGSKMSKSGNCPFCGQGLAPSKLLIDAYTKIFDERFELFDRNLRTRITLHESQIKVALAKSFESPIKSFAHQAKQFTPYVPELEEELQKISLQLEGMVDIEEEFKGELAIWAQQAQMELGEKLLSLHKSKSSALVDQRVLELAQQVSQKQSEIEAIQNTAKKLITDAKAKVNKLTAAEIESNKTAYRQKITQANEKIARLAQNDACALYMTKITSLGDLKKEIDDDVTKLEKEQSDYLDEYYEKLNDWFQQLGSSAGFSIKKYTNQKGDKKVYTLGLKFHGEKIPTEDLGKVFSESDKRNLALAIFLSRADKIKKKSEYILVFDDPVVSFDDNRRKKTCRIINSLSKDFRQIIVTTHYTSLVKDFVDIQMPARYVEIKSESQQSCFKELDPEKFVISPHQLACDKILNFIDGGDDVGTRDLRPFMEEHLHIRFHRQLVQAGIGRIGLENLIIHLRDGGLISPVSAGSLDDFRKGFNPEHHTNGDPENIEEVRNEARDLMDLLYSYFI